MKFKINKGKSKFGFIPIDPLNSSFKCLGKLKKAIKDYDK